MKGFSAQGSPCRHRRCVSGEIKPLFPHFWQLSSKGCGSGTAVCTAFGQGTEVQPVSPHQWPRGAGGLGTLAGYPE